MTLYVNLRGRMKELLLFYRFPACHGFPLVLLLVVIASKGSVLVTAPTLEQKRHIGVV